MTNGTIHNKDGFLNRIAERLGRNRRSAGVTVPDYIHQPQHRVYQGYTQDELVGVLKDRQKRKKSFPHTLTCLPKRDGKSCQRERGFRFQS